MSATYRSPGVYREEVFLRAEVALPTGVPGFIGFADAMVKLDGLPTRMDFPTALPATLKPRLRYDSEQKRLVLSGNMTPDDRDRLLALSPDPAFQTAVGGLFLNGQAVVPLRRKQEFTDNFLSLPTGYIEDAVIGFFENGGSHCYLARANSLNVSKAALIGAIALLSPLTDLDLVAVPDALTLQINGQIDREAVIQVQQEVVGHCGTQGDRMAILDALPDSSSAAVKQQRLDVLRNQQEPVNAALYYPWLRNSQKRLVPPCGHVAGIFARSDAARGVFKAPANEEVRDALDLEIPIDNTVQDDLNPAQINCLRSFPGRGIRVWGARTLSRDPNWRYINVRRVFLTLGRWIDSNMRWASFEPNSPRLWVRIQRELSVYLDRLWQAGALQGQSSQQAFYVKCDAETNLSDRREAGELITEIGLAVAAPAEFLIIRIIHRAGGIEVSA
ncbi:phage tail sheath subtilisin-like domain-containing protein [Leptolyngbya sp. FACHB-321]|uniref:phage tail sheath family protein n=1 Tax=Leptolyngbya sp. FACHB-321 TaxID=2692807 RepID=UPI0018EF9959|nr:phage tail sheath subtilisin-like domain-containing protein [Leptolyngbya sp. FACHB-321]